MTDRVRGQSLARRRAWAWVVGAFVLGILGVAVASNLGGGGGGPRLAFASAPSGEYAVVVEPGESVDVVFAVAAATGSQYELARLPHLPGYTVRGAVSPDGRHLAAIVADRGTVSAPVGALAVVDLESGAVSRLLEDLDELQQPAWDRESRSVVVALTERESEDSAAATVTFFRVAIEGAFQPIGVVERVAGAYAVGFDADDLSLVVRVDGSGSTLLRNFGAPVPLAPGLTRDWAVSPDGTSLAFVEVATAGGVSYRGRVLELRSNEKGTSEPQVAAGSAGLQQLGAAFDSDGRAVFGSVPAEAEQSAVRGFRVPLSASPGGAAMAVQRWSGSALDAPGDMTLVIETASGDREIDSAARFYGWVRR